jgi:hypothetical protein
LRDLDLDGKILRYPLSYLIYSNAFDGMPQVAKDYAYRRLREILSGKDAAPEWKHISDSDRTTVMEILNDTKPDFATRDAMR